MHIRHSSRKSGQNLNPRRAKIYFCNTAGTHPEEARLVSRESFTIFLSVSPCWFYLYLRGPLRIWNITPKTFEKVDVRVEDFDLVITVTMGTLTFAYVWNTAWSYTFKIPWENWNLISYRDKFYSLFLRIKN